MLPKALVQRLYETHFRTLWSICRKRMRCVWIVEYSTDSACTAYSVSRDLMRSFSPVCALRCVVSQVKTMLVLDTEASASLLLSSLQEMAGAKIWTMRIELLKHLWKVQAPQRRVKQVCPKSLPTILDLWWSDYTMSLAPLSFNPNILFYTFCTSVD